MTELNNIESKQLTNQPSKYSKFLDSTKKAVRDVLVKTWIAASTMTPIATTTTTTVIPASVNTITTIAPTASTAISTISLWAAASLLTACSWWSEDGSDIPEKDTVAPTINISKSEVDITWWKEIKINGNQLYIGDNLVASRSDNKTQNCNVILSLNWKSITSWTTISEEWTLNIKVSDAAGNIKTAEIKLSIESDVSWLNNLKNLNMQVDQEINLLNWVKFGNWAELIKTEIELDGQKTEIADPNHYTPAYPWTCSIILTVKGKDGKVREYKVDNLTIKALEYKAIEISNIKPEEIIPMVWQVEFWDREVYKHIEHLRLAEATKIRDMMREYWAWNHSAEEYQKLMSRLNTGMLWENPIWYDNYEIVWWELSKQPSDHAQIEWNILNTLIKHANFKVINRDSPLHRRDLYSLCKNNPNSINIIWLSMWSDVGKAQYDARHEEEFKEYDKEKNLLVFIAWWNIREKDWTRVYKTYQEDYQLPDSHSVYGEHSRAHNKNDKILDRHLMVTLGTNKDWDVDVIDKYWGSKFPVWFHDKVLFSWRAFPFFSQSDNLIMGENEKYKTSYTNYVNVAMMNLCFQMFAEAKDVDELLEMVRSTSLTDYIRLDWETQPLQLINPAWFFKKYLIPTAIPTNIKSWEIIQLNKWYYKWIIFDIPGAEVKINWQWIVYNDNNKSLIKSQNPFNLEWRINWNLCKKMWYLWKNITGKVIAVDDKRNWLNIDNNFSVSVQ